MVEGKISVIITVKNDASALEQLLLALGKQSLLPSEVIVTVAQSTDTTLSLLKKMATRFPYLSFKDVGEATRSQGRNEGVQMSTGDILVFTDAGCLPEVTWLEKLTESLRLDRKEELVSGLTLGNPKNAWEAAQIPFVLVHPSDYPQHPLPATRNMAVRRNVFFRVGEFRSTLNTAEDYEWSIRAQQLHVLATFVPEAVVRWRPRTTRQSFWQMIFSLTQGDVQARTWRVGHFTMLARYLVFAVLIWLFGFLGVSVWILYLAMKSFRTSQKNKTSFWHTMELQVLVDSAVCSGFLSGLMGAFEENSQS